MAGLAHSFVAGSPGQAQIMHGVGGERLLPELIVDWPPGYENSTPVRIGNALPGLLAALDGLVAMAAPSRQLA